MRTPDGPIPLFSLVPDWREGEYDLGRAVTLCTGDSMVTVKKIRVHPRANMLVLTAPCGWTAIEEGIAVPTGAYAHIGFSRIIGSKTQTLSSTDVQVDAFYAACWMSNLTAQEINKFAAKSAFYDLGVREVKDSDIHGYPHKSFRHTKLTDKQMMLWVYTVIATLSRLGKVATAAPHTGYKTRIVVRNTHQRDLLVWYLLAFGCRADVRYMPQRTQITVRSDRLAIMFGEFFAKGMRPLLYELVLFKRMVGKEFCVFSADNKAHFVGSVDNTWFGCVEEVEVKATPTQIRAVSFPELGDAILETNLLRTRHDT